jgi:hypothetical protein
VTAQDPYQHVGAPQGGTPHLQWHYPPPMAAAPLYSVHWPMVPPSPQGVTVDGYLLVLPKLKPIPSGPAIGSMIAGIGAVLAAVPGLLAAALSPWAGLTFFLLVALLGGGGGLGLAMTARRQIARANGGISGRGLAMTGLVLGWIAVGFALLIGLISVFNT